MPVPKKKDFCASLNESFEDARLHKENLWKQKFITMKAPSPSRSFIDLDVSSSPTVELQNAHVANSESVVLSPCTDYYGGDPKTPTRWTPEQLLGEQSFLSMRSGTNRFDSPGMPHSNVNVEPNRKSEEVLRAQCGTNKYASQRGQTAIGASRGQVPKAVYKKDWERILDKEGEKILPKQSDEYGLASEADEVPMGSHRNQVSNIRGRMPYDRHTHGVLCYQHGTNMCASQQGMNAPPGVGAVRQVTADIRGLNLRHFHLRRSRFADHTVTSLMILSVLYLFYSSYLCYVDCF